MAYDNPCGNVTSEPMNGADPVPLRQPELTTMPIQQSVRTVVIEYAADVT
jgi:hypothetical protein